MTDLRTAALKALEALENGKRVRAGEGGTKYQPPLEDSAIAALRAALEQPEQEPVAWSPALTCPGYEQQRVWANGKPRPEDVEYWAKNGNGITYAYTHPPRREWRGLTEEEIIDAVRESDLDWHQGWTLEECEPNRYTQLTRAIEAALKEKNHE